MDFFQSIFLGVVQGLSEFLPISSSGHLVLMPWVFGFEDPGLAFDVALHVGTLLAVASYFWRDWLNIVGLRHDMTEYQSSRWLPLLIVGTLPAVIAGFLLKEYAESVFRHPLVAASTLFFFGATLFLVDRYSAKSRSLSQFSFVDAMIIGIAQSIAIAPGVSRSGITITAALIRGADRVSAARFSFLLSAPIIFGAALLHAKDFLANIANPIFLAGVVASAISGYFAIKYLIRFLEHSSFAVFFWYRIVLAICIGILFVGQYV